MMNRVWVLTLLLCGCGSTVVLPLNAPPVVAVAPVAPVTAPTALPVTPAPANPVPVPTAPLPAPMPATPPPTPVQVAPLVVVDTSVLTVTLDSGKITIRLTDEERDTWMRLVMPDGSISPVTTRPNCDCIGLNRHTLRMLNVDFLAGMRVESSDTVSGPWTLAAWTQTAATAPTPAQPPVTGPSLTIADASLVTTELEDGTVKVKLTDDQGGVWLRLLLSDGSVSPITISPSCACIGLGGDAPHTLRFGAVRGVRVEVSRLTDGPWTLAASID